MSLHELKVQEPYFEALLNGSKNFEVRRNDRGFQKGDLLRLTRWENTRVGLRPSSPRRQIERVEHFGSQEER